MKSKIFSLLGLSVLIFIILMSAVSASVIAEWDFEDENLIVDSGTGVLTISDSRTATYPTGLTPSALEAMSTTGWDIVDRYIELDLSTSGYQDIIIKFDSQASATGPSAFQLQYSSDGSTFDDFGSTTPIVTLFTTNPMHTFDISSITAMDNNTNTEFRIVVPTGATGSDAAGTFRIDNLVIEGSKYSLAVSDATIPELENLTTITITNDGDFTLTNIELTSLEEDFEVSFSPSLPFTLTAGESEDIEVTMTTDIDDLEIGENQITITATANEETTTASGIVSIEKSFCDCQNPGDLDIEIKDITNKGILNLDIHKKFGDDEEWFAFEEIEVEVEVENKGDYDVDDVVLEWGLYNTETDKWTIEVDEEDEFNIKDGDEETITITFTIDDDMDENLDELDGGDFILYVRATGEIDDSNSPDDGDNTCISDSEEIEIIIENDFVILHDIELQETVLCGSEVQVTADVWNIGEDDQDDVYVRIYNQELGISEKVDIGDIDAFEDEKLNAIIKIPEDADEKYYTLVFWVYDEDDDLYENDFDEDESEFSISIKVEGGCSSSVEPTAVVSASLESGGQAGEELVIKTTITNTGSELVTYEINTEEYSDWASAPVIEPSIVILGAGKSSEVLITFNVDQEASGEKSFNIIVTPTGGEEIKQPVSVSIESTAPVEGLSGITGNVISERNWYLWAIGALNVLLILIIIVVAMRVSKN